MQLYIVRHGRPDYKTDTLLPEGERQARLVADRLCDAGITRIYSSPMGRARQTAQPLADRLGLPVEIEPWAYELGDESRTTFPDGVSKILFYVPGAYYRSPEFARLSDEEAFEKIEAFRLSGVKARYHTISDGVDGLLARHGYERNADDLYVPRAPSEERIALFCHAAMSRVLLSHVLGIPYRLLVSTLTTWFAGLAVVHFPARADRPLVPQLACYGDFGHMVHADGVLPPMDDERYL